MNEDKEKFVKEYQAKFEIHPGDLGVIADFWLNKMQESNKALLTKLRGEIEIERIHKPELIPTNPDYYESEEYFRHEVKRDENNRILDINIALIDKYLE